MHASNQDAPLENASRRALSWGTGRRKNVGSKRERSFVANNQSVVLRAGAFGGEVADLCSKGISHGLTLL